MRRALNEWQQEGTLSADEHQRLAGTLTRVTMDWQRLSRYADAPFRVTGSRPFGGETVVTSQVWTNGNSPVDIDWHVQNRNGRFVVTDVVVGGVSMKTTQRSEFASIIQRNGGQPDSLIAALRQQLAQAR